MGKIQKTEADGKFPDPEIYYGVTVQCELCDSCMIFHSFCISLTDELKDLLEILPEVLLAAVGGGQPLVVDQARVPVVEGQVGGDVHHKADVELQQQVEVLGVPLVPEEQAGEYGAEGRILHVGGHLTLLSRQGDGQEGGQGE